MEEKMEITAEGLLLKAMAIMGEEESEKAAYLPFLIDLVNMLLADCFEVNNAARIHAGKEALVEIPAVESAKGVLVYEYGVVVNVMSYGLAFWLLAADEENNKANICNSAYEAGKQSFGKAEYMPSVDNYR